MGAGKKKPSTPTNLHVVTSSVEVKKSEKDFASYFSEFYLQTKSEQLATEKSWKFRSPFTYFHSLKYLNFFSVELEVSWI